MGVENIRQLALKVSSEGIKDATNDLRELHKASKEAEQSTEKLSSTTKDSSSSREASSSSIEKYITKLTQQVDLLGKGSEYSAQYIAITKNATDAQLSVAASLGASVDAYKRYASTQAEAIRMNKEIDASAKREAESLKSLSNSLDLLDAKVNGTRGDWLALKYAQAGATAEMIAQAKKLGDAQDQITAKTGKLRNEYGMTAGEMTNALRGVPAQMTDIVVSLASGQQPLTVLLQQGGQLKDMFHGAGNAAKILAEHVAKIVVGNPLLLLAAALASIGYAAYSANEAMVEMRSNLAKSNNTYASSAENLMGMANNVGRVTSNFGLAKEAVLEFASNGKVSAKYLEDFSRVAVLTAQNTKEDIKAVVGSLEGLSEDTYKFALKYNESHHTFTAAQLDTIHSLQKQGEAAKATEFALKALQNAQLNLKAPQGFFDDWERGWQRIKKSINGVFQETGDSDKLNKLLEQRDKLMAGGRVASRGNSRNGQVNSELDNNLAEINAIRARMDAQKALNAETELANKRGGLNAFLDDTTFAKKSEKMRAEIQKNKAAFTEWTEGLPKDSAKYLEALKKFQENEQGIRDKFKETPKKTKDYSLDAELQSLEESRNKQKQYYDEVSKYAQDDLTENKITALQKIDIQRKALEDNLKMQGIYLEAEKVIAQAKIKDANKLALELSKIQSNYNKEESSTGKALSGLDAEAYKIKNAPYVEYMKEVEALEKQAKELANTNKVRGMSKSAIAEESLAIAEANSQRENEYLLSLLYNDALDEETPEVAKRIAGIQREVEARKSLAASIKAVEVADSGKAALDRLNKALDPVKAEKFGKILSSSFGAMSDSIGKAVAALQNFNLSQAATNKMQADYDEAVSSGQLEGIKKTEAQAAITYKSKQDEIRLYSDVAGAAKGMFQENSDGYKALNVIQQAINVAAAIGAVLNQAQGDPYTAFGRMAAMAAAVASLGVSIGAFGGGSSRNVAKEDQDRAGTGTVFGDPTAKSQSLSKAMELVQKDSKLQITYLSSMDASLKQLNNNIVSLARITFSAPSINGAPNGVQLGKAPTYKLPDLSAGVNLILGNVLGATISAITGKIFKTTTSVENKGIDIRNQRLLDIVNSGSVNAQTFQTIKTSPTFGGSSWKDYYSKDDDLNKALGSTFTSLYKTVESSAKLLGASSKDFNAKFANFILDFGRISVSGLSQDEIEKQFQTIFSKAGDQMASFLSSTTGGWLFDLDRFKKAGEGAFETLARVATNYATVNASASLLGYQFANDSVLSGVSAVETLIDNIGDLGKTTDAMASYFKNFYTEEEQAANKTAELARIFADQNLVLPKTRELYRAQAEAFKAMGDITNYAKMLKLADLFAEVIPASVEEASKSLEDYNKKLSSAKDTLNEAYTRESSALQTATDRFKEFGKSIREFKDGLVLGDLSPLSPLQKYVESQSQLAILSAQAKAGDQDAQNKLTSSISEFLNNSKVVNASGSVYQSDFEYAKSLLDQMSDYAGTQESLAQSQLNAVKAQATNILELNKTLISFKDALLSYLDLAKDEVVDGMTRDQYLAAKGYFPSSSGSVPDEDYLQARTGGFTRPVAEDANAQLLAEMVSLRQEVAGLREDANKNAEAQIVTNIQANSAAASQIVESISGTSEDTTWAARAAVDAFLR